jgi:Double zinc ribbon
VIACTRCQHQNPDGARVCNACAAPLDVVCPACGHANPPRSRFCNGCGAALMSAPPALGDLGAHRTTPEPRFASPQAYTPPYLAEKILTSRGALEGERKQVTVLFADVVGFSTLAERLA